MASKRKKRATPVAEMVQGFIQTPSTKYSDDPNGEYTITIRFTGEEEGFDAFKKWADDTAKKAAAKAKEENPSAKQYKIHPLLQKEVNDETGKETGNWVFKASQTGSWKDGGFRPLPVYTPGGSPWPKAKRIGRGSKVSISFSLGSPYAAASLKLVGVKAWLQAVQVVELEEYSGPSADDFGFTVDPDADEHLDLTAEEAEAPFGADGADTPGDPDDSDDLDDF